MVLHLLGTVPSKARNHGAHRVSRYRGNARTCPHCGVKYGDFRTGFSFRDVYHMVFDRKYKRRRGVLGAWHQLKRELWNDHVDRACERDPRNVAALSGAMVEVPF